MTVAERFDIDAEALAYGDKQFHLPCQFVAGAASPDRIPEASLPEIAFAGRSNVGKSSLINALTFRRNLARSSNTPGRTQQINFFDLSGQLHLVDLPGYGYAKVSRTKSAAWNKMVLNYLSARSTLARACVLIDARHGVLGADEKALKLLDDARVPYICVLTKADKVKPPALVKVTESVEAYLKGCAGAFPYVLPTSAEKGLGLAELRAVLARV